jgi:4'-phosphopantetheinyl transferase EntD
MLITRQAAQHAIPNPGIIKNIPAITAMNIHPPVWPASMKKKGYTIIKTASNATATAAKKAINPLN